MINKQLYNTIRNIVAKYTDFENDIVTVSKFLTKEIDENYTLRENDIRMKLLELLPFSSYHDIDRIINETKGIEE